MLKTSLDIYEPMIISVGNSIDLDSSIEIVLKMLSGYNTPEPIYSIDKLSRSKIYYDDKEEFRMKNSNNIK